MQEGEKINCMALLTIQIWDESAMEKGLPGKGLETLISISLHIRFAFSNQDELQSTLLTKKNWTKGTNIFTRAVIIFSRILMQSTYAIPLTVMLCDWLWIASGDLDLYI